MTMVAGRACLEQLDEAAFDRLAVMGERVRSELSSYFASADHPGQITGDGSLFRIHPHLRPIRSYRDARHEPTEADFMAYVHRGLLNRSVYLTTYGMGCLSTAMTDSDIGHLIDAVTAAWAAATSGASGGA